MTDYRPPLRDIRFVLDHVADIASLTELDAFSAVDADVLAGVLEEAGRFMAEVVAPTNRIGDTEGARRHPDGSVTLPPEIADAYRRFVAAGWNGIKGDPAYGGHGFPGTVAIAVAEMLGSANMALSLCPMLTSSAILALQRHGSEEQKATYLEKLISGEWTGTMVLTEPEAGSDVGALRTRAVPQGDGTWRIFGTKIFITWGEHDVADNIVHMVLARTPGAPPGTRGISLFIIPKHLVGPDGELGERNDLTCVSIEHKLGIHASPTCVMAFGEGDGAVGWLVGEENQGMRYMFTMMNDARLQVGLEGLSVAEAAYQQARGYARERRQGRTVGAEGISPIVEHPDVRRMLMTMRAYTEALRGLIYLNAAAIDVENHHPDAEVRQAASARAGLLTPLSKAWGTDVGVEVASLGIQVHGGMGFVEETGAAQYYRDIRIAPIYEGTNGIQAIDLVTRKLPMDGGTVVTTLLDEIAALSAELEKAGADFDGIRTELEEGVELVRNTSRWLLTRTHPDDTLAGATPYLRLLATLVGGWLLARQALAAHTARSDDADHFLAAKIATARFFCEQILPQAFGLVPAATAAADLLYAIDTEHL